MTLIEQPPAGRPRRSPDRSAEAASASADSAARPTEGSLTARREPIEYCESDWPTLDARRGAQIAGGSRAVFAQMQATLDSVEGAQIEANRMLAAQSEQIRQAFVLAAAHPELYVLPVVTEPARVAELAARAVAAELSMRLQLPAATIRNRAHETDVLQRRLPQVWRRFRDGFASYPDVRIALDAIAGFVDGTDEANAAARLGQLAAFDDALAEAIGRVTTSRFRQKARVLRARFEGAAETNARHARAVADRRVVIEHDDQGMAWVQLYTTSVEAARVHARLNATAAEASGAVGEHRTTDQLRADLAATWLTGEGTATAVRTEVIVTVPALSLIGTGTDLAGKGTDRVGWGSDTAELEGVGPIDEVTARQLFADAPSFLRLVTDPVSGAPLNLGRTRYRVTKAQRRWLELKYGRCTRPGCNRLAASADVDHLIDWLVGGRTDEPNLAPTCRPDHCLKHLTRFRVGKTRDGAIRWTTPFGFVTETRPKHIGPPGPSRSPHEASLHQHETSLHQQWQYPDRAPF